MEKRSNARNVLYFAFTLSIRYSFLPMTHDPIGTATKSDLDALEKKLTSLLTESITASLIQIIKKEGEETRRHFDVVAEDIRHDLAGANRDEISVLQDAKVDHGDRITKIETVVGLAA